MYKRQTYKPYLTNTWVTGIILFLLLLFSCSRESSVYRASISLSEAANRYASNPQVEQFIRQTEGLLRYARETYNLPIEEGDYRFLPGTEDYLAWRLVALPKESLKPAINILYYDPKMLEARKAQAEAEGLSIYVDGENPLQLAGKPAPLLEAWAAWSMDRQIERVFQLIFYHHVQKNLKRTDAEPLARFLAERATEEYLLKTQGGASPVLARYISEQRDEKTFATLFPDFAERLINLYTHRNPALAEEELEKSRNQLLKVWIAEYKNRYTERFLTNRYGTFGSPIPSDAEIVAQMLELQRLGNWKQYQNEYRRAGESVATYLKTLREP